MENETVMTETKTNLTWWENFWVRLFVAFLEGAVRTAMGLPARRY
jgi:hypothetical protein